MAPAVDFLTSSLSLFFLLPPPPLPTTFSLQILNTNGAGDSFVGTTAAAIVEGHPIERAIKRGLFAAKLSVQSDAAVAPDLCADLVRFI